MDDLAEVRRIDQSNFAGLIESFPEQLEEGSQIASAFALPRWKVSAISNIVVAGLGGSAIAAELVKFYLNYQLKIPFLIVRHYQLPEFVSQKSLVIVSSYSGDTEETLSAYKEAKKRRAKIIGISSGGQLRNWCQSDRGPFVNIPPGLPPRAALGYSLSVILLLLGRLKLVKPKILELKKAAKFLAEFRKSFTTDVSTGENHAKQLAQKLYGKIPIIYAGEDYFYSVAVRWKQQICENAKVLSFCNAFPEFNHNELVGWEKLQDFREKLIVVMLRDKADHKKIQARMQIVVQILKKKKVEVIQVESRGKDVLTRILSLVHLGDWASYYLALLNEVDPTPVGVIDHLKKSLAAPG
ncbi:MAG: bifunctional phosphoglucose/phosphomannose isomerase [candidate division Zixibacteria bacterium RBG_16_48_11]|nr:MAG: bifunctional phosphoglucose/phosphomannose isomerase [candidate division Zixibacteria bacterium RBG_16_48_11]